MRQALEVANQRISELESTGRELLEALDAHSNDVCDDSGARRNRFLLSMAEVRFQNLLDDEEFEGVREGIFGVASRPCSRLFLFSGESW